MDHNHLAYGPPPGLAYPPGLMAGPGMQGQLGQAGGRGYDLAQAAVTGSAHGEFIFPFNQGKLSQVRVPSAVVTVRKLYNRP